MSEKIFAFKAATAAISKDTNPEDAKKILRAAQILLVDMSPTEEEDVFAYLEDKCPLTKTWQKAFRQELKKLRKKNLLEGQSGQKEPALTAFLPNLVDLVLYEDKSAFLLKGEDQSLIVATEYEFEGVLNAPPSLEQIPWLLPRATEVRRWYEQNEPFSSLYDDLLAHHKAISELPSEAHYDFLVSWVFHTYLLEPSQYSPEICFFAVPERGKSRTGKGLIYVCRRGVHVESLRDAYLVRLANNFEATIFLDVMNLWKKAEKMGCEDIILGRFERGITVPRVLYPERGAHRDTVFYKIYGPTIIATNIQVHNILDTRAIQINMPQTDRRFEINVTPEGALTLKERLTAWRAHHLGENLPAIAKPASGRLGDITQPLLQILKLVRPQRVPVLINLINEIKSNRLIDKSESMDGQILQTIASIKDQVERGILPVKVITDCFNKGKSENAHFTYQRMGHRLKSLGFEKGNTPDGAAAILWDEEKFLKISSSYGLGKTSETSEASESTEKFARSSDVSDDTDDTDVFSQWSEEKKSSKFYYENLKQVII